MTPTEPAAVRVIIVTDVCLFREGLGRILAGRTDVQVVASVSLADPEVSFIEEYRPDIVLVDAATVRASEVVALVRNILPATRVVAFAVAAEDEDEVLACAEAGVAGFVARSASVEELVAALRSAVLGEVRCPPQVAAVVFRQVARLAAYRKVMLHEPGLTHRETEIVSLIESGLTNKEIAQRLGIEVATVKNHVHNLLEKLHVRRRWDVATIVRSQQRARRGPDAAPRAGI